MAALATAGIVTVTLTPAIARLAVRTGFLDHPAGYKEHGQPTPYLGGVAVMLGVLTTAAVFAGGTGRFAPILLIAAMLAVVGTLDDRVSLAPSLRVLAGVTAGIALFYGDLGWHIFADDGLNLALTIVWVLGVVNAFNLMDNLDGASSTVAAAVGIGAGSFALSRGDGELAALSFALTGACVGFLRHNLARPARIFLGDGGSMSIGFVAAAIAMSAPNTADLGLGAVLCAAMLVGLVILDTTLVIVSRVRRRAPVLSGARDHLTHRLLALVGTPWSVAALLLGAQLALGALSLAAAGTGRPAVLWTAAAAVVAAIAAIAYLELDYAARRRAAPTVEFPAVEVATVPRDGG